MVTSSNLSAELKATVSGLLLLGVPQVLMLAAVALVGKSGLNYLRGRMLGFAKTFTPPNTVGRIRYRIGLVLFVLPLFFGSLSPYLEIQVPLLSEQRELFAITGDGMFFLSFFVLGGDFWDKVRSLFVHDATAVLWNHDGKPVHTAFNRCTRRFNPTERGPMTGQAFTPEQAAPGWRLKLGVAILMLSVLLPIVGISVVAGLGLSTSMITSLSGALLVSGEVFGILAVAVMGKPGFAYLKSRLLGLLKRYGPPKTVGRGRYTFGLMMFVAPILFGLLSPYFSAQIPGFIEQPLPYAVTGDLMLVASLFVLGGDFWDKLRSLFVHDAHAVIPQNSEIVSPQGD
ncbi:MAG: transporter suffix domain-containing protein [Gammaproteobacteria bacterium]|nr:transporter suffix domain-containing protein [Gammaproteobacteria bacterium]